MGAPDGADPTGAPAGVTPVQLSLGDVTLLAEGTERGDLDGLALTIDSRGIVLDVRAAGTGPRVLPWSSVTAWHVEGTPEGAVFSVRAAQGSFRFLLGGADPASLASYVGGFARLGTDGAPREQSVPAPPSAPVPRREEQAARRRPSRAPRSRRSGWRVALAVGLVLVLATGVALVLAQSAGLVHLPFLGPIAGVDTTSASGFTAG